MPTFLFTDIEGSTELWAHHPEAMNTVLAEHDQLLRLLSDLSQMRRARDMLEAALSSLPQDDTVEIIQANSALGRMEWIEGRYEQAIQYHRTVLQMAESAEHVWYRAGALNSLGVISWVQGDISQAEDYFLQARELYSSQGDEKLTAQVLDHLGVVQRERGNFSEAAETFRLALEVFRGLRARFEISYAANHLAGVLGVLGQFEQAEAYWREALQAAQETGDRRNQAFILLDWGQLYLGCEDAQHARPLVEQGIEIMRSLEEPFGLGFALVALSGLDQTAGNLAAARLSVLQAAEIGLQIESMNLFGMALTQLVSVLCASNQFEEALLVAAFALAQPNLSGNSASYLRQQQASVVEHLATRMSSEQIADLQRQGAAWSAQEFRQRFSSAEVWMSC